METNEGVLYIASGADHVDAAIRSAESLKRYNDVPVTLVSDRNVQNEAIDTVAQSSDFLYHYGDSVMKIPDLPYDKTLLLDTDVYVFDDITGIFDVLDEFDIGASIIADNEFVLSTDIPATFPEYNTGVVAFRNCDEVSAFIQDWKEAYSDYLEEGVRMNQPAFRETLYESDLRIATLPTEYNCRVNFGGYLTGQMKILHGDVANPRDIEAQLNESNVPRTYYQDETGLQVHRIQTTTSNMPL